MPRKKVQENTTPPTAPDPLSIIMAKMAALQKTLDDMQQKIDAKDPDLPDKLKAQFDLDDPRVQRTVQREVANSRKQLMADMVEWIPTRTDCAIIEGNRFDFKEGVKIRVPRAVVNIVEQSDRQYQEAARISARLEASNDTKEAIRYEE